MADAPFLFNPVADIDGPPESGVSLVQDMVIGRQKDVKTRIGQIIRVRIRSREIRIA